MSRPKFKTHVHRQRCPSQHLCPHVVYSSTSDPSQPQGSRHCATYFRPKLRIEWSLDPRCCRWQQDTSSHLIFSPAAWLVFLLDFALFTLSHPASHLFSCCFLPLYWGRDSTAHFCLSFFVISLISCIENSRECDLRLPVFDID